MNRILLIETAINTYNIIFFTKKTPFLQTQESIFHSTSRDPNCISLKKKNKKKKKKRNNKPGARTRNYEFPSSNLKLHLETPFFPSSRSIPRVKEFHPRPRPISPSSSKRKLESSCPPGQERYPDAFSGKKCSGRIEKSPGFVCVGARRRSAPLRAKRRP